MGMKYFTLLITLFSINPNYSQDNQYLISLSDTSFQKFKPYVTNLSSIMDSTVTYGFTYNSDGLKIKGYYSAPKGSGNYPVVIYNRGGNRDFGQLTDERATLRLGSIASWGYVVVASNYRGSTGSEGQDEFGGSDVNDILNLLPVISQMDKADTSRLGVFGWSRGGMMTYKVLSKSCQFKAAVIGAGVADAFRNIKDRPEMEEYVYSELIPNYNQRKEQSLKDRSAVHWPDQLCKETPLLLLHGSSDWRVSPEDALDMADKLYELKHPFRLLFLEGGDHGLTEYRREVDYAVKDFLDYYVKNLNSWPSMKPHGR